MRMRALCCLLLSCGAAAAQSRIFAGGAYGIAAISADGQTQLSSTVSAVSSYKPQNGGVAGAFAGYHFNNWFSVQGLYFWQRNDLTINALRTGSGPTALYEQKRDSSEHGVFVDFLIYFRPRTSRLRPWLATGAGAVSISSNLHVTALQEGGLPLPPERFSSTQPAIRSSVGIDITAGRGWGLRYSFAETISRNPFGAQLLPRGERNLASFQNLFGLMKSF